MTRLKQKGDLFSVKVKKERKSSKRKIKKQDENQDITSKKTQKLSSIDAQPLTYKTLTVGQVLLGCISEVRDYELVVSLPHKLVGSVSLAHISRPYTALLSKLNDDDNEEAEDEIHALQDLYQPGQYVVTSVVSIEKINNMTKVSLTLMPNEVNFGISASCLETGLVLPCAVASVEDKGYALDTGIYGIKGAFLKKENTDSSCTLGVGSVLRCIITNIFGSDTEDNLRLTFSAAPKAVSSATLDLSDTVNMALLLPGTAVNTTISKIQSDAITLMLADLDGIVSSLHLAKPFDQLKQYSLGDSVRARVLYVTPLSKVVHFTLQKSVCCERPTTDPLQGLAIGNIIREAEIYKTSSSGIYMKLNSKTRGFCSGNHLNDTNKILKHITRDFPVGKKTTCRLLKYNHMDQLFIVSLQKSVLEQQFVAYSELEPGQIVEATVSGYDDTGARLAVSKLMSGHVPSLHLTNKAMKHPERKHAVGNHVTARVLKVNSERHHLLLTLKTRLVKAKESILTEYTPESENMVTVGYVIKVIPSGLLIGMFNDVKGFAPRSQVGVQSAEDLSVLFKEGQVVRCRVLKVYPEKKNIILSLLVDDAKPLNKVPKLLNNVEMRSRVKCVVNEVKPDIIRVSILPENIEATIPVYHLSDDTNKCTLLRELIKEKDEIMNAVVFSKAPGSITLSLKPSVSFWIDHGSPEALHSQDLVPEESYPAVVSDIKTYGLFVMIPSGNTGKRALVHIKNLITPGKLMDTKDLGICIGQSLYVSFKDRDEKGRPSLTSAVKDNLKNATQSSLQLLYSYLKNEEMVARGLLNYGGQERQLAKFRIGDTVVALVTEVTPQEIHVRVKNSTVAGIVPSGHQYGKATLKVGQKVKARVLHVNQEDKYLELTLKPNLILNIHTDKTEIKMGMKVKCEVILSKNFFTMVVMKSECKGTVAYLPSVMHMNMFSDSSLSTVGKKCWVVVKHIEGPLVLGILKCHDKGEDLNLTSKLPEITFSSCAIGETDSEIEEEIAGNEEDCEKLNLMQSEQSIREDTGHSKTLSSSPVDSSISQTSEETQQTTKKRQLENKEAKKSKKLKSGKVAALEQAREDDLNQHDSFTKKMNEEHEESKCEVKEDQKNESAKLKPCLIVRTGFVWDVPDTPQNPEMSEASESEDEELSKKKAKQLKRSDRVAAAQEEERRLHQLELSRLEESQTPQSALEFEALLQNSPNSSAVWIQFISFHLESAEVDKAKAVAQRALQVIDTQEEEERLNIWTVLLRLEVLYGTPETVAEAYREALATNDQLKIHLAMAMVYAESNKIKEAEKVYFNVTRKFSQELSVWIKAGIFFYTHNMVKEGRHYLDRALHSLDKKDHVELTNRFAQLEFRFGEMERGRTMFESLLSTYWKRMDIWGVYVDLLSKRKDIEGARHVLERMTGLKLKLRKMRFVFKKFLDFEKEHGTSQSVEAVKQRVEDFVAATLQ